MFHHVKEYNLMYRYQSELSFAKVLLEQFGGPNGALKAAVQYFLQAFGCKKAAVCN